MSVELGLRIVKPPPDSCGMHMTVAMTVVMC